jgi:hypothetical protein
MPQPRCPLSSNRGVRQRTQSFRHPCQRTRSFQVTRWGCSMALPVGVDLAEPYVELSYVDAVYAADGSAVVVDVRADERIEPKDAEALEVTHLACGQAGWGFERVGMPDAVLLADVRWLSRYRHPRCLHGPVVECDLVTPETGRKPGGATSGNLATIRSGHRMASPPPTRAAAPPPSKPSSAGAHAPSPNVGSSCKATGLCRTSPRYACGRAGPRQPSLCQGSVATLPKPDPRAAELSPVCKVISIPPGGPWRRSS